MHLFFKELVYDLKCGICVSHDRHGCRRTAGLGVWGLGCQDRTVSTRTGIALSSGLWPGGGTGWTGTHTLRHHPPIPLDPHPVGATLRRDALRRTRRADRGLAHSGAALLPLFPAPGTLRANPALHRRNGVLLLWGVALRDAPGRPDGAGEYAERAQHRGQRFFLLLDK